MSPEPEMLSRYVISVSGLTTFRIVKNKKKMHINLHKEIRAVVDVDSQREQCTHVFITRPLVVKTGSCSAIIVEVISRRSFC